RLRGSTFGVVTENGFHLEEVFEAVMTPFATVARLLVATEGRVVVQRGTVEMDHAGANLTGDIARAFQISGGDVAGQPVAGVIGDADGVCLILVADDRQHGSEDLLTGDRHVVGDMPEHGGLDVIAAIQPLGTTGTADHQTGAFLNALGNQVLDLVPLCLGHDRAHGGVRGIGSAGLDLGGYRLGDLCYLIHAAVGYQHAGRGVTGLPSVVHAGHYPVGDHLLEVHIVEQDIGGLATQFQCHPLDGLGAVLHYLTASAGRAGKGHHVDIRM